VKNYIIYRKAKRHTISLKKIQSPTLSSGSINSLQTLSKPSQVGPQMVQECFSFDFC